VWPTMLTRKIRNPYSVSVGKVGVKRPFGGARRRRGYTELELKKVRRSGLDSLS